MNGSEAPGRRTEEGSPGEPAAHDSSGAAAVGPLVRELALGMWAYAALACADETGMLDQLTERRSVIELAQRSAVPVPVAGALLEILETLGLVRSEQGTFFAQPALTKALRAPARDVLRAELRSNLLQCVSMVTDARERQLRPGWGPTDPLALHAQGGRSAHLATMWIEHLFPALDGLLARLEGKDPWFLDVGVGVATLAIGLCRRFPQLRAVGLDPLRQALDEAAANVDAHALAKRIELRQGRVEDLEERDTYDLVHVPAMFLPPAALEAGLARILAALRPGGWVLVQTLSPRGTPLESAALRLCCSLWGGEPRDAGRVGQTLTLGGFECATSFSAASGWPVDHAAGRRPVS